MKKFVISLVALSAVLVSCSKEPVTIDLSATKEAPVFTATFAEQPEVKASFSGLKVSWAAGDEILIKDSEGKKAVYVADAAGETSSFSFKSGDVLGTEGVTYEAFFPYNETADEQLPVVQVYGLNGTEITRFEAPMHAEGATTNLAFKNLCGLLKIDLKKAASVSTAFNLKYILLEADKGLTGTYTVDGDKAVVTGTTPAVLNMESAKALGTTALTFYLWVPEGNYASFDITAMHNDTSAFYEQTWSLKGGSSLQITRNVISELELEVSNPAINLSRDWFYSKNVYTLSTANCYNAKVKNARYKIKAVKGNSSESVGAVASGSLLWAAVAAATPPTDANIGNIVKNVRYSNGYVYFERGGSQGNFVMAAKDASDNILWSWLIWGANAGFEDVEMLGGAKMMDRNIGTFANTAGSTNSIGLLYQYGRKDPFPGRVAISNTVAGVYGTQFSVAEGGVSAATAVANPTVFYKAATANNWSSEASVTTWDGLDKTIYDPCPVGYRVPDSSVWKEEGSLNTEHYVWDTANYGFLYKYKDNDNNDVSVWFPATGQLGSTAGTINSGTAITFMWCRDKAGSGNPLILDVRYNAAAKLGGYAAAGGVGLRCEKITE